MTRSLRVTTAVMLYKVLAGRRMESRVFHGELLGHSREIKALAPRPPHVSGYSHESLCKTHCYLTDFNEALIFQDPLEELCVIMPDHMDVSRAPTAVREDPCCNTHAVRPIQ